MEQQIQVVVKKNRFSPQMAKIDLKRTRFYATHEMSIRQLLRSLSLCSVQDSSRGRFDPLPYNSTRPVRKQQRRRPPRLLLQGLGLPQMQAVGLKTCIGLVTDEPCVLTNAHTSTCAIIVRRLAYLSRTSSERASSGSQP